MPLVEGLAVPANVASNWSSWIAASFCHREDCVRVMPRSASSLVLQLRVLAPTVVRLGGTSLVTPSPSRPCDNEGKPGDRMEQQTCEQSADLRNAEHPGCDQAQAARDTGLLSFALLPAARRSWAAKLARKAAAAMH